MNDVTIQIEARHLAAAIHSAGKHDLRYYLNAVYIEATETETRTTATEGHVCITLRSVHNAPNVLGDAPLVTVLLPRDVVERVIKSTRGKGAVTLSRDVSGWKLVDAFTSHSFFPVDGKFPDYRSIFPRTTSGEIAQYDPELLMRFKKAAKALGVKWVVNIEHNGSAAARITLNATSEFCGVVMPVRIAEKARSAPDVSWVAR